VFVVHGEHSLKSGEKVSGVDFEIFFGVIVGILGVVVVVISFKVVVVFIQFFLFQQFINVFVVHFDDGTDVAEIFTEASREVVADGIGVVFI
jgi:hypothetical protein